MSQLPPDLSAAVPPADLTAAAWWESLSESSRDELAALCDPRRDEFFFDSDAEDDPPAVRGGRFIPHDDAWGYAEWGESWLEHLLEHPEVVTTATAKEFTFHICTRHPVARAALAVGTIPADFDCPFASADCPMRRLLVASPGHSVRLVGTTRDGAKRVIALPVVPLRSEGDGR